MSRLIYFLLFLVSLVIVMNISKYRDQKVVSEKFNFEKVAKENHERQEMLAKLNAPKEEKKEEEKAEVEGPLVELTTPELQNGSELYKKCIVCHGKRGEGKAGQKAPAIGGQYEWYVKTQITNMKSGERVNKVMNPYISRLSDEEINNLATYVSKLPYMGKK